LGGLFKRLVNTTDTTPAHLRLPAQSRRRRRSASATHWRSNTLAAAMGDGGASQTEHVSASEARSRGLHFGL
jgi:hypothetical protein